MIVIKDNFTVQSVVYVVLVEERIIVIVIDVEFVSKMALRIHVLSSVPVQIARYAFRIYIHRANARN
jgi:hypothetical protein